MILVLVISDENYNRYANNLICSIQSSNSIDVVHVSLKEGLAQNTSFVLRKDLHLHKIEIPHFGGTKEQNRIYSATCRYAVARELLMANPSISCLIYIDADSLVRHRLEPIVQTFLSGSQCVGLRVRKGHHPYLSGVLLLGPRSIPFLDETISALTTTEAIWGQDQTVLEQILSTKYESEILELNATDVGWDYCASLKIWSAKGVDRRRSAEFIFESWALPRIKDLTPPLRELIRFAIFRLSSLLHSLRIRKCFYFLRSLASNTLKRLRAS
jgi:hypothetical protein